MRKPIVEWREKGMRTAWQFHVGTPGDIACGVRISARFEMNKPSLVQALIIAERSDRWVGMSRGSVIPSQTYVVSVAVTVVEVDDDGGEMVVDAV